MRAGTLTALGAFNGLLATILSAAGAHALPARISEAGTQLFKQGTEFHLIHALALLLTGVLAGQLQATRGEAWAGRAGIAFQAGIIGFSASLYWRALMGPGSLGTFHWVTPLGGMLLMAGWAFLAVAGLKGQTR